MPERSLPWVQGSLEFLLEGSHKNVHVCRTVKSCIAASPTGTRSRRSGQPLARKRRSDPFGRRTHGEQKEPKTEAAPALRRLILTPPCAIERSVP